VLAFATRCCAQQLQAELERIDTGGVRQFIEKRLKDPSVAVAAGSAQRIRGDSARHER